LNVYGNNILLYDLLVSGINHNLVFHSLTNLNYEIFKYNYNQNLSLSLDLSNNLQQKFKHIMLKCDYHYVYSVNGIVYNTFFSTYHTFTSSGINSTNLWSGQYLNILDFVIDQNTTFKKNLTINNNSYNVFRITNLFKQHNYNNSIISLLKNNLTNSFLKMNQNSDNQIIFIDNLGVRINPKIWIKHILKNIITK
jgi:hypothetical protein